MKQRRTKQQWLELIKEHQQSGLTATHFCRNKGIAQKYFSTRKCQLLRENQTSTQEFSTQEFTKITIDQASNKQAALQYIYKDAVLKFDSLPNVKWLANLIRTLS